jgi:TM2 domain-containing membrane protein YozV
MNCEYCNNAIPHGVNKCPSCGAPVTVPAPQAGQPVQQQNPPPPIPQIAYIPVQQQAVPQAPQIVYVAGGQVSQSPLKSKGTAAVLAFFLGAFGGHNFYLGHTGRGVVQLILGLTIYGALISGLWAFIEFILILTGGLKDSQGRPLG